ncbi:MAG TPA: helix-hairpin-helix domain-containing protein, partial [Ignavibacteriaceae bacterium]
MLLLIAITGSIPAFLNNGTTEPEPSLASYEDGIRQLEDMLRKSTRESSYEREDYSSHPAATDNSATSSLFVFDPNIISEADWKKLGVRDKTIRTIRNYLTKGGRFRKPEDLNKIYGLNEKDVNRLVPFVKINAEESKANIFETAKENIQRNFSESNINYPLPLAININEADTSLFIQLPGIGSKLSQRIINFRDKLGGFYSVDQVGETFGLADSVFQKIKSRLTCGEMATKKIDIN